MSSTSFIRSSRTVLFDVNPANPSCALWSGSAARLSVNRSNPSRCKRRRRVSGPCNAGSAMPSGRRSACSSSITSRWPRRWACLMGYSSSMRAGFASKARTRWGWGPPILWHPGPGRPLSGGCVCCLCLQAGLCVGRQTALPAGAVVERRLCESQSPVCCTQGGGLAHEAAIGGGYGASSP